MSDLSKPQFSSEELLGIREGINGVKRALPPRFYHDEAIYQYEVEHILRKNWLCVGRWDDVENPGDYFTVRMWNDSIIVVRDQEKVLHALVNVCRHRYAQVVEDGHGNTNLFTCPYHAWTYNLDGSLRGISLQDIDGLDRKKCALHRIGVEEWHGFVFINFDPEARPLAPQIEAVSKHFEELGVGQYRQKDAYSYDANWNWKFSFETGFEGYHHCGIHRDRINHIVPGNNTRPMDFGETCGSYTMWMTDELPQEISERMEKQAEEGYPVREQYSRFIGIYPNLIMFLNSVQCTFIITEHHKVDLNRGSTRQAFSPKTMNSSKAEETIAEQTSGMRATQEEDTYGCSMLQKGVTSGANQPGVIHPLEQQLNHYHNWYVDQILAGP